MSFNIGKIGSDVFGNGVGDSLLILGDIVFSYVEIPGQFNFGGQQLIKVHQLIGGARVVDALGRSDADITFGALFFGENAAERARAVDFMRMAGKEVELIFGEFVYLVIIKEFNPVFERYYQVRYDITLTVINNLTLPVPVPLPNNYNSSVDTDLQIIGDFLGAANSTALTAGVANLASSITSAGNLATASQGQLNDIIANIRICQGINNTIISGDTSS